MNDVSLQTNQPQTAKTGNNRILFIFMGLAMMLVVLFFAKMMYDMVGHVGTMAHYVKTMSEDMSDMRLQFDLMVPQVSQIDDSVDSMSQKMTHMDSQIATIQQSISKDIKGLNKTVEHMSINISQITLNINHIQNIMLGMSRDINYGTRTFTHPRNLFKNMTD